MKPPLVITSEEEFLAIMEDIDREMASEGIKVSARPFIAGMKLATQCNITLNGLPSVRPPKINCFDPLEISIRVHDWVIQRYGNRLKVPFKIGQVVIPLRGDLYLLNCPTIFGTVNIVCERETFGKHRDNVGVTAPPTLNILDLVEDLTFDFAHSLTAEEAIKISIAFTIGIAAYLALREIKDVQFVPEAISDLDAAVFHLIAHQPHAGLSKWASLQAVEKLIKAYITQKGGTPKFTHSLEKLFDHAKNLGLPLPPERYINDLQCPAGVRYGEIAVSIEEANKAHLISLEICELVAQYIGISLNRKMPIAPELKVNGNTI